MSINKVMITGNLTRDPELRSTPSGTSVLTFGVAVNDRRRNPQTEQWEDYANFVDCTMFGRRAQSLANILSKGMKVAIEGRLHYSSWESNGQRRSKLDVTVDEIEFLSARGQGGGQYQGNQQSQNGYNQGGYAAPAPQTPAPQAPTAAAPSQMPPSRDVYDEDIPF